MSSAIPYGFSTEKEANDYKTFAKGVCQHVLGSRYLKGPWCYGFPTITTSAVVNRVKDQLIAHEFHIVPSCCSNTLVGSDNNAFNFEGKTVIRFMPHPDALSLTPPTDPLTQVDEYASTSPDEDEPEETLWNAKFTANAVFHYVHAKLKAQRSAVASSALSDDTKVKIRMSEWMRDHGF